jgi:FKBP-type peptidyl-prolyl cis-trans isomerase
MSLDENLAKAEVFLAENAKKEDVQVTATGLQYIILVSGSGTTPQLSSTVVAHYSGRFLDGTEFDSSIKRGQPLSFPVTGVISGWTEALQLMNEGDKWRLFVPPHLAYGDRGTGPIPGNSALIFDVELIEVK